MKSSYEKYQALSSVHESERIRLVRGHVDGSLNMHDESKKYGVTKDTFMNYVNKWLIDEYKKETKIYNRNTENEMKDLSFTERLQYELSKINQ